MANDARKLLGKIGLWTPTDHLDAAQLRDSARQLEGWGYGALWQPEALGRDRFATIVYLAGQTRRLGFATGIAHSDFGFDDADFANDGSDRLVDDLVAWGDERAIRERIQAHLDAGADHVCVQALRPVGTLGADLALLETHAPGAS